MTDTERERINEICEVAGVTEIDDLSDGFHTFRQLYYQRMILFAAIVRQNKDKAWKSLRHEDGELCFGGGWFIVGIDTPEGSYTYHYENKYFDLFDCEILDYSKHWDGHTEKDVTRLLSLPVQPDHIAEFDRKVSISCGQENDLISRKAAIEALARMMPRSYTPDGSHPADEEIFRAQEVFADCIEALEIQPSAQPATSCSEIPNGSDDTISRQTAIDAMKDMYRAAEKWLRDATDDVTKARAESCMATLMEIKLRIDKTMGKGTLTDDDCMEAAKSVLGEDELPAAQPEERKKGAWILGFDNQYLEKYYYCSNCGCRKYTEDEPSDYFCSKCGSDMRGGEKE